MANAPTITDRPGPVHVGIGGWDYDPWRGTFYPPSLPRSKQLEYASRRVTAIEINATFYKLHKPELYARWAAAVPEGFKFALKGSRFCINRKVLGEAGEAVARFCGQGLAELGDRLGPILWQFAETKSFDPDDIRAFLALLPRAEAGVPLRHALEPRHESFLDPLFVELAREAGVAVSFADAPGLPVIDGPAATFAYARLKGMREEEPEGYPAAALDLWAEQARGWAQGGREVFVFMINGAKLRAPAAAQGLLARFSSGE